ncbi:MAG TPA: 4Fe-4S dicluster domain-containing protein [Planctomycetota bacterium]|nr:4Fe-4S dicluster domain-containing protein [Planctomycetota bacterium]HRR80411.1 4Fe-4S dicluster domain-containing protein [Planctomycetota bacterium]HRT96049.1 4Fe-4S dicluster domain-containing protein [Planctomycetota bacterium]
MNKILDATRLPALLDAIRARARLVAPAREDDRVHFREIAATSDIVPRTDYINPRNSIKEFLFPRSEPILTYARADAGAQVADPQTQYPPTVLFGCRPCDARSLLVMDPLYNWDYCDPFWNLRRAATTVIAIACTRADEACFCTALGSAPNATDGADLLLTPLDDKRLLAEILTPKGEAIAALAPDAFRDGTADKQAPCKPAFDALPPRLDLDRITAWLKANFENPRWAPYSYKCWGCGCCTFLCPTCHCFDIVDEGTYRRGARRKNWDACQFALFTLHASGHNPRPDQAARWRQRIEHKFNYYVQKFNHRSCVGCGRCIRHCPVNMNILAQLTEIATL